ncbi:MAG: PAS domain-containing protein [Nitriliruptorales bacterium]|nr:PAS domain-containing protein [Nitriliruptorales bacterium]
MTMVDRKTLDLLPDPTVVVSRAGVIVCANNLAARLLGVPAEKLEGCAAAEVLPLVDEVRADWWSCARPLEGDARLVARIPETELRMRLSDGRERPVIVTAARQPDECGRVELLMVSLRRADRRARIDATGAELVSTVSHELRSPLTSVRGFTKTMLAKWGHFTDEQKLQMLRTVNEDADRVTRLLGELLDVSRIDAGELRLRRQMVDVAAIVERVLGRFRVVDERRSLVSLVPADLPRLHIDPDKVEQVFINLVENAIHHGEGAVTVSADAGADAVTFTVSDQGPGIPAPQIGHVFAKFARPPGERRAGTGLGLYITKGIVEAHGGRIWAESAQQAGTRFDFTLLRESPFAEPPRTSADRGGQGRS